MGVKVAIVFLGLLFVVLAKRSPDPLGLKKIDPDSLFAFAEKQINASLAEKFTPKQYPVQTEHVSKTDTKHWKWTTSTDGGWTSGFWPSILWQIYDRSKVERYKGLAQAWTAGIRPQENNTGTHDVGFMVFYSFGHGYLITKDPDYKAVVLRAAHSLSTRYSPIVGCIRSWNGPHFEVIIDNMMNLELLWWASQNGGDKSYFDMAVSHADHMIRDCIKSDGSSYHMIVYNENNGNVISKSNTPQGMPGGVWSRGEAWAVYGFTIAYRYSRYQRYLDMAQNVSDFFISHLPSDYVPYWDFYAPHNESRDSSAAAIAASGMLELSTYLTGAPAAKYREAAINILTSLASPNYLADPAFSPAILLHGTGGDNSGMDVSFIFGDYYFIEALRKYEKIVPDQK